MKARYKYILSIIAAWLFLFFAIFVFSDYILTSGFLSLERKLAEQHSKRTFQILLSSINYVYVLNLDNAYWDDTYEFVKNKNTDYIKNNLAKDLFVDNKLNYVIVLNAEKGVVWAKAYDLVHDQYMPFPESIISFFQKNSENFVKYKSRYNDLAHGDHGIASFLTLPNSADIAYFAVNPIFDSNGTKKSRGFLIFGKIITPKYEDELMKKLFYPVNLISLSEFYKAKDAQTIFQHINFRDQSIYIEPLDKNYLASYRLVRDFNFNPIAVLRVDFSRDVYRTSLRSSHSNQLILLAFSLFGVFSMCYLVYIFFRRQDLITRAFERFVPHKLLQLLEKTSILEITLGDSSKRTVSVLFMDIRNFTTLSERLTAKENFDFVNKILRVVAPLISKNRGFIDKYIGDAVMAIFTDEKTHADDAVNTAVSMVRKINILNKTGELGAQDPIRIGIGINSGETMLGIIGAEGRLEGTVISDTVNLASRLESLTKSYDHSIFISKQCYEAMRYRERYVITYIDEVYVKGKAQKTAIYSVTEKSV